MAVTITIAGNRDYCKAHNLGTESWDECVCVGGPDSLPNAQCSFCGGSGALKTTNLPFEMNFHNEKFVAIWQALDLPIVPCGAVFPHRILKSCEIYSKRIKTIKTLVNLTEFLNICNEAARREELIEWG
jgi:hypothetical protein